VSTVTTTRRIDLLQLGIPATIRQDGDTFTVEADADQATLQAAVDACPLDTRDEVQLTLRQQALDSLTVLRTSIDTLQAITDKTNASIGPADTKQVARECRRVSRQVLALTRLILGELDSSDTGSA
jgi:hypothetical protein